MANAYYERGSSFNPDELADGDAIEAEFDAVVRGFDTIETQIDTNKAGYPTQTFHVAPATEATHSPQKAQLDAHVNDQSAVHGATSVNSPGRLMARDINGDVAARTFVGDLTGNAGSASNATEHIATRGYDAHGATSGNSPGNLMMRDINGDVAARTFVGDLTGNAGSASNATEHIATRGYDAHGATSGNSPGNLMMRDINGDVAARTFVGVATEARMVSDSAPNGGSATLVYGQMGGSDSFRLLITGTDDGGWAEIATSDNGNEPIFVRQYTGGFANAIRTLTLLDAEGDTRLPQNCYANGFDINDGGQNAKNGLYSGNTDGASSSGANVVISSWFGVGFSPSLSGQPVPINEMSHWFDTRSGNGGMRGTLAQWSDERLKTEITVIPNAIAKVNALRGVIYTRKDSGERCTGMIAQEVQAVLPEAVTEGSDENKTLSVAYGNTVGLLVEAIKELTAKVEALESRVGV